MIKVYDIFTRESGRCCKVYTCHAKDIKGAAEIFIAWLGLKNIKAVKSDGEIPFALKEFKIDIWTTSFKKYEIDYVRIDWQNVVIDKED